MNAGMVLEHTHPGMLGQLHNEMMNAIVDQIEKILPEKRNYYLDTGFAFFSDDPFITWSNTLRKIQSSKIDNVFLFGFVDPTLDVRHHALQWYNDIKDSSWPDLVCLEDFDKLNDSIKREISSVHGIDVNKYRKQILNFDSPPGHVIEVGYTDQTYGIAIDFWAIWSNMYATKYQDRDLKLNDTADVRFLCYQNKPHLHRQYLRYLLDQSSYQNRGIMTLSPSLSKMYHYDGLKPVSDPCMPDNKYAAASNWDNCTLGDLERWQNSFLIVTSETCSDKASCFVSEKTWKPIIGLRPFVINGGPKIYQWLEKAGFDTFEDLWSEVDLRDYDGFESHCRKVMSVIAYVCEMTPKQISSWYTKLMPRLVRNREHFRKYSREQELLAYRNIGLLIKNLDL